LCFLGMVAPLEILFNRSAFSLLRTAPKSEAYPR
jgi:hypothetical protein